jgi:hypothetical protein
VKACDELEGLTELLEYRLGFVLVDLLKRDVVVFGMKGGGAGEGE